MMPGIPVRQIGAERTEEVRRRRVQEREVVARAIRRCPAAPAVPGRTPAPGALRGTQAAFEHSPQTLDGFSFPGAGVRRLLAVLCVGAGWRLICLTGLFYFFLVVFKCFHLIEEVCK